MVAVTATSTTSCTRRSTGPTRHLSATAPAPFRVELGSPGAPFSTQNVRRRGVRSVPAATYRRRRLAALVVAAGLAFVAWVALGALGGVLTAPGRSAPDVGSATSVEVVGVAPGDTLWSIARRLQPSGDVRPLVDRLAAAHGGTVLQVGERIAVSPRR